MAVSAAPRVHILTLTRAHNLPRVQHPPRHKPTLLWRFVPCRTR